jgi:hypothetical protein
MNTLIGGQRTASDTMAIMKGNETAARDILIREHAPHDPEKTLAALATLAGFSNGKAKSQIDAIAKQTDKLYAQLESISTIRTQGEFNKRQGAEVERLMAGKDGEPISKTREELAAEFRQRKAGIRAALKPLVWEAAEIARPVLKSFRAKAESYLSERENLERAESEAIGSNHFISENILTMKAALVHLESRLPGSIDEVGLNQPRTFLAFLK